MKGSKFLNNYITQIQKQEIQSLQFSVMVHTFEIIVKDQFINNEKIREKSYVKSLTTRNDKTYVEINPYHFYNEYLYSLKDFEKVFNLILAELEITEYRFKRIDIAVDTKLPFERCYKLNMYLSALWGKSIDSINNFRNIGEDCKKRSIFSYNRSYTLAIYDKHLESKGKYSASRIEFRFRRVWNGYNVQKVIQTIIHMLNRLPEYITHVSVDKFNWLHEQYKLEQTIGYESNSLNFSNFINKWVYDIFNWDILNDLYLKNNNGKCKNWFYRFKKRGYNLTLYYKSDLILYLKQIKKALLKYCKATKKATLQKDNVA